MKMIAALFVIGQVCVVAVGATCVTRDLHITVDNIMELYINGIQITDLPNYNDWQKADTVPLACYARVIAVKGTDYGVVAGMLASTDDGYILTNSSWKCTDRYYAGWEQLSFDHSTWPDAYQAGIHQTAPWSLVPGIRTDAYWIWTRQFTGGDLVAYCRKELIPNSQKCPVVPGATCPSRNLYITVDNIMELYINGIQITDLPNYNNWQKADTVPLTCNAKVIAIKGTDYGVVAGMLASTDDGYILTNSSWKCTNRYYAGWEQLSFDHSTWPDAYQAGIHQTAPWSLVPGIRTDAYWIWTQQFRGGDLVVYCRKELIPQNIESPSCCPRRDLSITVDNYITKLYIDGVQQTNLPNADNWRRSDTVPLPCSAQVIAVQGTDDGIVRAGILASTADGYVLTNASWKCTNVFYAGWESSAFDDTAWPQAHVIAIHQTYPWSLVRPIRTDAYWIWTASKDITVYCRKRLPVRKLC